MFIYFHIWNRNVYFSVNLFLSFFYFMIVFFTLYYSCASVCSIVNKMKKKLHCQDNSKIQYQNRRKKPYRYPNTQLHDLIAYWLGTDTPIKISLVSCVVFCRSMFVHFSFSFCSLHCLSFFDVQLLVFTLIYSNFSWGKLLSEFDPGF